MLVGIGQVKTKQYTVKELTEWERDALRDGMPRPTEKLWATVREVERLKAFQEKNRQLERQVTALKIHLKRALNICEKFECADEACTCPGWHSRETKAAKELLK